MNYIGIDHHRQFSHVTVMDQRGQVLRSGRVANLQSEIERFLEGLEAVIETGRSSYTMVDVLEEMGVAVKIAHPHEVNAIARAKIKTDKRDSEVLAHLLRMNMVPEVYRRSPENRQAQRVLRQRAFYVSAMTALKNRVHAFLAQQKEEVRLTFMPMRGSSPRLTAPATGPITGRSSKREIAGCVGRRWRRSGRPSGRILTCAAFTNGWPVGKGRTKRKWPWPGDF